MAMQVTLINDADVIATMENGELQTYILKQGELVKVPWDEAQDRYTSYHPPV